jgi:hypothetical protein
MPTIPSMKIPVPKDWQEFESLVRDAMILRWNSPNLQKNGRTGQSQQGVDVWGPDEIGRRVGIQCKRHNTQLNMTDVAEEVTEAEKFKGTLSALFLATTTDHDSTLQTKVRQLSDQRVAQGKFAVSIMYWDEIITSLALNPNVFKMYYPMIQPPVFDAVDKRRVLAALDLGFYGADLWAYVVLIRGEIGQMAQEDPDEIDAIVRVLEVQARALLAPPDADHIDESLRVVLAGCKKPLPKKSDWDEVEFHAKRVSQRVQTASSLLRVQESNVLNLGLQLGSMYHHADKVPEIAVQSKVEKKVRAVLPNIPDAAIAEEFEDAKGVWGGHSWANRICSFVERELRFGS